MSLGIRPDARPPKPLFVATADLPSGKGHPFYDKLNAILIDKGFDRFVEELCAPFYAEELGRPSLWPGRYFRLLFAGYYEGISS